jgi:hypothetical protein
MSSRSLTIALPLLLATSTWGQVPEGVPGDLEESFVRFYQSRLYETKLKYGEEVDLTLEVRKIDERHQKLFGVPMPEQTAVALAHQTSLRTMPEELRSAWESHGKLEPDQIPSLFVAEERLDLYGKAVRSDERFDPQAAVRKLSEEYLKKFKEPIPDDYREAFQTAADWGIAVPGQREPSGPSQSTPAVPSRIPRGDAERIPLPDWFHQRDTDADGQLGFYEWPPAARGEFATWDLNGDGFIVDREVSQALLHQQWAR